MKKLLVIILALALTVAVFTGCSSNKFRTVDEIKKSGELIMLTNAAFEPFEYISGGTEAGVDVDLATMIADSLGVKLTIVNMDFELLIDALNSGKGDLIAAGMTATEERAKSVDFSTAYVDSTLTILVAADSGITSPEDLDGLRISVQEGTTSDLFVSDYVDAAEVLRFKDAILAGNSILSGKSDACVLDELPAKGVAANSNGELIILDEALARESFSMAVVKGNSTLVAAINSILEPALANGVVDELVEKHMTLTTSGN